MKKKNNWTYLFLGILFIVGIGYAVLQANLEINGTTKISSNTWDIHFNNIQVNENSVSIGTGDSVATIDPNNNCKVDFEVTLSLPGDFYEFTVDVVNAGTIDGMIGELNKSLKVNNEIVSEIPDFLEYSVTYEDGMEILRNHALNAGTTETYKVRLEFRSDIEELPDATTIEASLEPQFIQADDTTIARPITMFADGQTVNIKIKKLAGVKNPTVNTDDSKIYSFLRTTTVPDLSSMTESNIISSSGSTYPIYAWYDTNIIYYYSEADTIYLNYDSSNMFSKLNKLVDLDINNVMSSKTTNMEGMFYHVGYNVESFSLDLSNWNTSKVENMTGMFSYIAGNSTNSSLNVSSWDTSNVRSMRSMFNNAFYQSTTIDLDISRWNTSKVESIQYMFDCFAYNISEFNLNISEWDTSSLVNMESTFIYSGYNSSSYTLDLSKWDVSHVTTMRSTFYRAGKESSSWTVGNLSNWNTSNVTDISSMFSWTGENAINWSVGDLSNWNVSKVSDFSYLFASAGRSASSWTVGNLSNWNTSSAIRMNSMFECSGYYSLSWSVGDLSSWNVSKVEDMSYMFWYSGYSAQSWSIGNLSNWDTLKVTNMTKMFPYAGYYATTWNDIGTLKIYNAYIQELFNYCPKAKATLKIYYNPTSYSSAFYYAATSSDSGITVNYTSDVTNIDNIIATKASTSNVVKGSLFTP